MSEGAQVVATMRLEVVKPCDGTWDDLGLTLRALRAPLHRVLNGVVAELELAERGGSYSKGAGGGPNGKDLHPRTDSYRLTRDLWGAERQAAADRVDRGKGYAMDEAVGATEPSSAVVLGVAGEAYARWSEWKKERWKGTVSLPSFRKDPPIFVASSSNAVRIEPADGLAVLDLRLASERVRMIVRPYGARDHGDLRAILADPSRLGSCKLVQKKGRDGKRKWTALVSWKRDVRERVEGRVMAVHRGVSTLLTVAIEGGSGRDAWASILDGGGDIRRHKDIYRKRRRALGRHGCQLGNGAKGHGVARRHERITRLEDKEARWVDTRCKQAASRVVKLAVRRGVGTILIEDWTNPAKDGAPELGEWMERVVRTFPLAQLRGSIEWAAKREGIAVEIVPGAYQSRACPKCGHMHDERPVERGTFLCAACSWERSVEVVAALNMLPDPKRAAAEVTKRGKRAAAKLRGKAKR